jgi:hypothetical protein
LREYRRFRGACENGFVTKSELHELVDKLPDDAIDGAAVLLEEIAEGRIDPDQAWFWTREWQEGEQEADAQLAAGEGTVHESTEDFVDHLKKNASARSE